MIIENIMSDLKLNRGCEHFRFVFDVVLRPDKVKGFKLLPRRWVVEEPSPGSIDTPR